MQKRRRVRHLKRGTVYRVLGEAKVQCSFPIEEGDTLMIYRAASGQLWARPKAEFEDGRFEDIALKNGG